MLQINENNYYQELLALTLANASTMPFYSKMWTRGLVEKVQSLEDLKLLPLITRDIYQNEVENNDYQHKSVKVVHHTSGTTSGKIFFRYRTSDELKFISDFFQRTQRTSINEALQVVPQRRIILNESNISTHGTAIPFPTENLVINLSSDYLGILHFIEIVQKQFYIDGYESRPSIICGYHPFVVLSTLALLENGINPKETAVDTILALGFLSSKSRQFLQVTWGAKVITSFSLSEVFGSASICPICQMYSFKPTVIAEFLDPVSREPVEKGLAVLVLTELYPFVCHNPLIRYWTDDLVWVEKNTCDCNQQAFSPKGRFSFALRDSTQKPETILLTPLELYEALEETPEVVWSNKEPWVAEMFGSIPRGKPHASLSLKTESENKKLIVLNFECAFSPLFYPNQAKKSEAELRHRLLQRSPSLQKATNEGGYELIINACPKVTERLKLIGVA